LAAGAPPGSASQQHGKDPAVHVGLPPKLTYGQIKGFTLYATRTILSGEGSELVELTKTNLRQLDIE
jgi:pyruvate dehydrogenase (quinone)